MVSESDFDKLFEISGNTARRKLIFFLIDIGAITIDSAGNYLFIAALKAGESAEEIKQEINDYFLRSN